MCSRERLLVYGIEGRCLWSEWFRSINGQWRLQVGWVRVVILQMVESRWHWRIWGISQYKHQAIVAAPVAVEGLGLPQGYWGQGMVVEDLALVGAMDSLVGLAELSNQQQLPSPMWTQAMVLWPLVLMERAPISFLMWAMHFSSVIITHQKRQAVVNSLLVR